MINENFVLLAALFNVVGCYGYAVSTIKGKTTPNRVTWFLWALAPLIAFVAELYKGVGITSLMTFMVGFGPLVIFIASFVNRKSVFKVTKLDIICGVLSICGLLLWFVTREGNVAIFFSIMADFFAAIPTIVKSYREPETENHIVFMLGTISAFITLLTVKNWDFPHFGFPLYIFLISGFLFVLIKFKIGVRKKITS